MPRHEENLDATIEERAARRILLAAVDQGRAAEFLDAMRDGGSATVDAAGMLVIISGDQLAQLGEHNNAD